MALRHDDNELEQMDDNTQVIETETLLESNAVGQGSHPKSGFSRSTRLTGAFLAMLAMGVLLIVMLEKHVMTEAPAVAGSSRSHYRAVQSLGRLHDLQVCDNAYLHGVPESNILELEAISRNWYNNLPEKVHQIFEANK